MEKYTGWPFREGPTRRLPQDELVHAMDWLHQHFVFIAPDDTLTIPTILQHAKALLLRYGIRGLILDPWNEFDHTRQSGQTETDYICQILTHIRQFARAHGVHVWVVAHPQKLHRREDGSYPVPTPYDISGSAHWRNKADNCLTIWRDENDTEGNVKLYVQKVRFREVGKIGMVELRWSKINGRYDEALNSAHDWRDER